MPTRVTYLRTKRKAPHRPRPASAGEPSPGDGTRRVGAAPGRRLRRGEVRGRPRADSGKRLRPGSKLEGCFPDPARGPWARARDRGGTRRGKAARAAGGRAEHARRPLTSCSGSGGRSVLRGPAPRPPGPLSYRRRPRAPARSAPRAASSAAASPASAAASPRLRAAPAARGGGGFASARRRGRGRARTLGPTVRAPWPAADCGWSREAPVAPPSRR